MSFISIFIIIKIILSIFFQSDIQNSTYLQLKKRDIQKDIISYSVLMYKCDICYRYFVTKDDLLTHLKEFHPYEYDDVEFLPAELKEIFFNRMLTKSDQ
jgi:hypothetical protein